MFKLFRLIHVSPFQLVFYFTSWGDILSRPQVPIFDYQGIGSSILSPRRSK